MSIKLEPLPYKRDALAPYITEEMIQFHYDKHHAGYVAKLNTLLQQQQSNATTVEGIIINYTPKQQALFNNAAQIYNHTFYWNCLKPVAQIKDVNNNRPCATKNAAIHKAITNSFGSFENFKTAFTTEALAHFGSGWCWLVLNQKDKKLAIVSGHDADTPLKNFDGQVPVLTCDLWEHAYYILYKNDRAKYVENFFKIINWDFADAQVKYVIHNKCNHEKVVVY